MKYSFIVLPLLLVLAACAPIPNALPATAPSAISPTVPTLLEIPSATILPSVSPSSALATIDPFSLPTGGISVPTLDLASPAGTTEPTMKQDNPIQALINAAVHKGESTVNIPKGIYRLDSGLYLSDLKNLTIEGNGSQFIFTQAKESNAAPSTAVMIQDCAKLILKNIIVDYDPLPFTQGTVIGMDPGGTWVDVKIHAGYRADAQFLQFDVNRNELSVHLFDPTTGLLKTGSSFLFPDEATEASPGVLRFWFRNDPDKTYHHHMAMGDYIATSAWRIVPFTIRGSADTKFDNVTIWAAGGAAITEKSGEGGTDLKINLEPGPTPPGATVKRLWAGSRDGYHVGNVRRGPVVHDSRFISVGDDMINVHTYYFLISSLDSAANKIVFSPYNHGYAAMFQPGDTLIAYDPITFVEKARTKILSVDPGSRMELESVQGFAAGDVLASPQVSASGTIIRDSVFRNGDAGALAIKAPNSLIENNQIEHIGMDGIGLNVFLNYYYEGTFAQGMIIRGNTIHDTGFSALILYRAVQTTGAINIGFGALDDVLNVASNREFKDILIENNTIDDTTNWGLYIENASGVTVRGNHISNVVQLPAGYTNTWWQIKPTSAIFLVNADHIIFTDNLVNVLGPNASQAIVLDPSADAATIDLKGITVIP